MTRGDGASEPSLVTGLRARRTQRGWTQSALADRAGVSRQALVAIEAGRQIPSTVLALQLARCLDCSVEDLFQLEGSSRIEASASVASGRVVVGNVDGQWVAHPVDLDSGRASDGVVVAAAPAGATVELLGDAASLAGNVLIAGCAPLIGVLTGRFERRYGGTRAAWLSMNSGRALDLLDRGLVHAAGVHLVDTETPGGHEAVVRARFADRSMAIISLNLWRQGLIVANGNPLRIEQAQDILRDDVRWVRREAGSGAERLLRRELGSLAPPPTSLEAMTHAEIARLVRWGVGDVGIGTEAAALAENLSFVPLAEERFDLLMPAARLEEPTFARLVDLAGRRAFRQEASCLPGYDVSTSGHALTISMG